IVGLLGPNGAGKSTSFNMVAGLVRPDAGKITLGNDSLARLPLYQRARMGLGYLAQESTVFRGLTVLENLLAVLETRKLSKADCLERADAIITKYALTHVRTNLGSQLSGGERRRLEMARTIIHQPRVVLLDEPFAGVDPIAVGDIKAFITAMRDDGIGVLITDHNVRETLKICDRAYIISEGKILLSGTPEVIVADPVARASYLGKDFSL
ncbi:MAG: LPS export ABC transporter ATP-binding protein, partial [Clostridia bacterium]|nr:LPS export ABC transporter ATP-binding protein [Deltaproteobacteria bacterium]